MAVLPATRILVIDDEPLIRLDARAILEDAGYLVLEASTADEALQLLTEPDAFDAILTDVEMPGSLNGLELARTVDGLLPAVAIVIMSGRRLPQRADMPLKAAFVAKPFTPSILLQRVAEALVEI
jgi:CheY-like chemotaxis protein